MARAIFPGNSGKLTLRYTHCWHLNSHLGCGVFQSLISLTLDHLSPGALTRGVVAPCPAWTRDAEWPMVRARVSCSRTLSATERPFLGRCRSENVVPARAGHSLAIGRAHPIGRDAAAHKRRPEWGLCPLALRMPHRSAPEPKLAQKTLRNYIHLPLR